jgi:hypothetical protein
VNVGKGHPRTACTEALFCSSISIGSRLTRAELDVVVDTEVRRRGGVINCAAEMAARYGEVPECAARRMLWALRVVTEAYSAQDRLVREPA